ncbi:DNA repair protein RecO [Candidatus Hepatincolaceae symbiont of Richtersius coronifer]
MNFSDEGILLSKLKYGESSLILTIFTKNYGIQKGLLKGGNSLRNKSKLEVGNVLNLDKRARLEEQLGFLRVELKESFLINIFFHPLKSLILTCMCDLLDEFLPEKEADEGFYNFSKNIIISLQNEDYIISYILWEVVLLEKIGFGLDISQCAVSKLAKDLYYISPNTGKAVIKDIGEIYKHKLFVIPSFFSPKNKILPQELKIGEIYLPPSLQEIKEGFKITGHFLDRFSKEYHKRIPFNRKILINKILSDKLNLFQKQDLQELR